MKKYDVIISSGKTEAVLFSGLTHRNAVELCASYGWEIQFGGEGSFVWDLEIVEHVKHDETGREILARFD